MPCLEWSGQLLIAVRMSRRGEISRCVLGRCLWTCKLHYFRSSTYSGTRLRAGVSRIPVGVLFFFFLLKDVEVNENFRRSMYTQACDKLEAHMRELAGPGLLPAGPGYVPLLGRCSCLNSTTVCQPFTYFPGLGVDMVGLTILAFKIDQDETEIVLSESLGSPESNRRKSVTGLLRGPWVAHDIRNGQSFRVVKNCGMSDDRRCIERRLVIAWYPLSTGQ